MDWYIPFLIFGARCLDVPLGTVRMIFVINGHRYAAATLGFFEVAIWALAVGGVISNLSNPFALFAYAGGFAAGTLLGMIIEERIALGWRVIRVINAKIDPGIAGTLRQNGYRVTRLDGTGRDGPVEIAFMVVKRKSLQSALALVKDLAPEAFVTVERADRAEQAGGQTVAGARRFIRFGQLRK
mgnify:CR=1 FL=1